MNMSKPTRGALIVVEGLDRAGKSSQCEVLRDRLEKAGHDVKHIRFPGIYTQYPQAIRENETNK